ncbi:MAG TPA: P-II family nitrogen regulator [Methanocella sp.]|nr:P-II family nitrogen regulator [Methanocella sp.]
MKMIQAVIRPEKLDNVKKALSEKGFNAMSIIEVRGRGEQKGITLEYRGKKIEVDTLPKIKIEIVVDDKDVEPIIEIIRVAGRTGKFGDGKIFVMPVEMMAKVRTDEVWK